MAQFCTKVHKFYTQETLCCTTFLEIAPTRTNLKDELIIVMSQIITYGVTRSLGHTVKSFKRYLIFYFLNANDSGVHKKIATTVPQLDPKRAQKQLKTHNVAQFSPYVFRVQHCVF